MSIEANGSGLENNRPYDPWEKFRTRNEAKHRAEDHSRLCPVQVTSLDVIHTFFSHENRRLDEPIPRRRQLLRDFLKEAVVSTPTGPHPLYENDVTQGSTDTSIALLDDRQNHAGCAKLIFQPCNTCHGQIFSRNLTISALCDRLKLEVRRLNIFN